MALSFPLTFPFPAPCPGVVSPSGIMLSSMITKALVPFPYPCESFPDFETPHEAAALIAAFQAQGHIKKCSHVDVEGVARFYPRCHRDSFQVQRPPLTRLPSSRAEYDRRLFLGCPPDCHYYEPAWKGKTKEWLRTHWWPFRRGVVGIAQWFASLSPAVQVILALALLALAGAPWRITVLEGLKIIFGK